MGMGARAETEAGESSVILPRAREKGSFVRQLAGSGDTSDEPIRAHHLLLSIADPQPKRSALILPAPKPALMSIAIAASTNPVGPHT